MVARAICLNRRSTDAWNAWGWVVLQDARQGDDRAAKASEKFRKACDINDRDEWSAMGLARSLSDQGEYDLALASIKRAVEINDRAADAFGTWGDILAARAASDRTYWTAAIEQYEHALAIDPAVAWIQRSRDRARSQAR
jgi:tetratricopeptide (TPR) repeat protein